MTCRYKNDRYCPGCAPGDCAYQYDRDQELAGIRPQRWEFQIRRAALAGPVLVIYLTAWFAVGLLTACTKALDWFGVHGPRHPER